ncbi:hypothetical protein [Bacteroides propionicifaciens]|uniref:hypothetical protein n=1 Tax=Bacteroides propionicifaciens TaxID=392838 RepID=UPI0003642893|nr:hypothetical protein [Bacteroides propionicifaciens]
MKNSKAKKGVSGLCTIVFIIFLFLKLTDLVTWSWWWITSPLWLPLVGLLIVVAIIGFLVSLMIVFEYLLKHKTRENE